MDTQRVCTFLAWLRLPLAAVALAVVVVTTAVTSFGANATSQPSPHGRTREAVALAGALPRALALATPLSPQPGTATLSLAVTLRIRDAAGLAQLIADQQNPKSPHYHHWLSSRAFTDRFAPTAESVAKVVSFLQSKGLRVTGIAPNRLLLDVSGTVAQTQAAFGVTILRYSMGQRAVYAPDRLPTIPGALAPLVVHVAGLDNIGVMEPHLVRGKVPAHTAPTHGAATPAATPSVIFPNPIGGKSPSDLESTYATGNVFVRNSDPTLPLAGYGQHIGVFELAPFITNDIVTYRAQYGLPNATITDHSVDGAATRGNAPGTAEADLDFEMIDALAWNASEDNYVGPNSATGVLDTYSRMVTDNSDQIISTSWGECESRAGNAMLASLHQLFMQAAGQGQSIFAAAGDFGSDDCHQGSTSTPSVDSPASDPYVFGVGGVTYFRDPTYNVLTFTAWNHDGYGTGGGLSGYFSMPSWQAAYGVQNHYSTGAREVPDLAGDADPDHGVAIYCTATPDCADPTYGPFGWLIFGGTSVGAPNNAALLADMNRYLLAEGKSALGWANQAFYVQYGQLAPVQDVLQGNNDTDYIGTTNQGKYPTGLCYDMATGMGLVGAQGMADLIARGIVNNYGTCYPSPPLPNRIQDPSFEYFPNTYWSEFSARGYESLVPYGSQDGGYAFYACGYPGCDDRISQTVQLPSPLTHAQLDFWISATSGTSNAPFIAPPTPPSLGCLDHMSVQFATQNGTVVFTLLDICAGNTYGYYHYQTNDFSYFLAPYAGQPITLTFRGTTANIAQQAGVYSGFLLDSVSFYT